MAHVPSAVDCIKVTGQIDLVRVMYLHRLASQHLVPMSDGLKAVVDISHVPVEPYMSGMRADVVVELVEHLPFEFVLVLSYFVWGKAVCFRHLMN